MYLFKFFSLNINKGAKNYAEILVPDNNNSNDPTNNANSNNGNVKESIPSTTANNQLLKQRKPEAGEFIGSPIKYSNVSIGLMKLPFFEWKQDTSKGTKSAEYYLNIYYHKKKNSLTGFSISNSKIRKK